MKKAICKSKKAMSLILTMTTVISVLSVCLSLQAGALTAKNLCENGDFETGDLTGYTYPYASIEEPVDPITVEKYTMNGVESYAAKLMRDGDSLNTADGRALNKKLELPAGKYQVTFDADISYSGTSKPTHAFIYGIYKGVDAAEAGNGRLFDSSAAQISSTSPSNTFYVREGEKNSVSVYNDAYITKSYRISFSQAAANSVKCSIKMEFELDGSEEDVFLSLCVNSAVTAYVDNIIITREEQIIDGVLITPNSDFENGSLNGFTAGTDVKVVNAAQNEEDNTTFSGYAAYLPSRKSVATSNITYQMVAVPAGTYTVSFDFDAFAGSNPRTGGNILVGLYKGKPGSNNRGYNGSSSNELATELKAFDKNNKAANVTDNQYGSTVKFTSADEFNNLKFTATFTLTEETDMFLGVCFYNNGYTDYAYLDNLKVAVADGEQLIENGDFELGGLYGYEYTVASDTPIIVEKHAFVDGDENNYAAKLNRNAAGNANGKALNKKLTGLEAGVYTLSFDADVTASSAYSLYYGIYTGTPNSYGRMYDTNEQISVTPAENTLVALSDEGLNGVFAAQDTGYANGSYRLSFSGNEKSIKAKVMLNFTVDGTEDSLYLSICVNNGTTAYIDNIKLYSVAFEQSFSNGDYAKLTFKNAPFTGIDRIGYDIFVNNNATDASTEYFNSSAKGTFSYLRVTENGVYYCDVNGDLKISAEDIAVLRKVLLGTEVSYNKAGADVNGDAAIDIMDLVCIKKALSEKEKSGFTVTENAYNYLFKLGLMENDTLQVTPYIISGGEKIVGETKAMKYSGGVFEDAVIESLSYDFADGTTADTAYIGEYK